MTAGLEGMLPEGREPAEYAVELLRSTHRDERSSAEQWLLTHPERSGPALARALNTPSAQAAATLLGELRADDYVPDLVAAHERGGIGLRTAVEAALEAMDTAAADAALARLRDGPGS